MIVNTLASEEVAVEVYKSLLKSLVDCGFQLTKWICKSEKVMEETSAEDRSKHSKITFDINCLGLQWNVKIDIVEIKGDGKRSICQGYSTICSHLYSVFDPLGLFSPFRITKRLLLKGTWKKHGHSWDKKLSPEGEMIFMN